MFSLSAPEARLRTELPRDCDVRASAPGGLTPSAVVAWPVFTTVLWHLRSFSPDYLGLVSDLRMYHNSSQKRHWTFASEEQLARLRADANRKFKCKAVANGKVRTPAAAPLLWPLNS